MCGLVGFIDCKNRVTDKQNLLAKMVEELRHRGPDDQGFWLKENIALGHARLAIQDLSQQGHQPMWSSSQRYIIIYNGEIYNFKELAKLLTSEHGFKFHGHSDTEVMLAAFEVWGIERSLQQFNGMFAFVLWDSQEQLLYLVRDRLGIKPLYFGWLDDSLFGFSSELKPFFQYQNFNKKLNHSAVAWQLQYAYVPAPLTIYEGIQKLEPAQIKVFKVTNSQLTEQASDYYWSAQQVANQQESKTTTEMELVEQLNDLLQQAVKRRMLADVSLGAFLSGGIDSSTVVSLMQAQSSKPIKTFSIGFAVPGYNEAQHAKAVAAHLGTDHTEFYVTAQDALAVVPQLPTLFDEPFSDSSQIPTYLVSKLARQQVTVSLSGDGGDELFAGYNRYLWTKKIWNYLALIPKPLRIAMANMLLAVPIACWDKLLALPLSLSKINLTGDKLNKLARVMDVDDSMTLYARLLAQINPEKELVYGINSQSLMQLNPLSSANSLIKSMMFNDLIGYLPNDILTKVDRASMAVSLEARVPLLDYKVVEFAWRVPLEYKLRDGKTKWLLRQVLSQYVPIELIERPKMGFAVPLDSWLRQDLKDWGEELLKNLANKNSAVVNVELIKQKWQQHQSGKQNWQHFLWNVLMFQAWFDQYQ